jgi:uncharacterized protein (TIGR03086 family)
VEPIEMFERASSDAAAMVGRVRDEQWHDVTPCTEWDVEALVSHMTAGFDYLDAALGCAPPGVALDESSYRAAVQRSVASVREPGVLERRCVSPAGFEWSVAEAVAGTAMDQVVHTWDLAVAIGADRQLNSDVVAACVTMFLPQMPTVGREAGLVGPEVHVAKGAPAQDVLLGAMGRSPLG